MARETKTIQMYPDDDAINQAISLWENFGWEVIGNQRCQEFKKQDSDGTQHFETFNKITFSRDKSASWYGKVAELEQEYIATENELQSKSKQGNPYKKPGIIAPLIAAVVLAFAGYKFLRGVLRYIIMGVGFLLPIVIYIIRIASYNKHKDEIERKESEWYAKVSDMRQRLKDILEEAEALING